MIKTLSPYSSKTDEIMSKYRPIAPKPQLPCNNTTSVPGVPEKFRQSPYLRNVWSHLQARPTRTRKWGRAAAFPASVLRKQPLKMVGPEAGPGPTFIGLCPPTESLSFQVADNPVTLPLLSCPQVASLGGERNEIDLNTVAAEAGPLEEKDLILQLQVPLSSSSSSSSSGTVVISPRPVRPVGSSIRVVGPISEDPGPQLVARVLPEEVEAAAEAEALPAVISDRSHKVRMVNSAYKELVGQPECPWLDSMVISSSGKRISGEVMLQLADPGGLPVTGNGFSCWVRIEWEIEGKSNWVNAFAEGVRLECESKDYHYSWRFHTREVSPSGSKI